MNIYNLNNGYIEIYNLRPLHEKIRLFKQKEMEKIPEDERVLKVQNKQRYRMYKNDVVYNNPTYVLKKSEDEHNDKLIEQTVIDEIISGDIRRVQREDKDEELFFLELFGNKRIQLTQDLCNLLLIEREDYDSYVIDIDRINIIKDLFELDNNLVEKINFKEIEKLYNTGLMNEDLEEKI